MLRSDSGEVQLQAFEFNDVLGKTIVCDDGVARKVESIAYSHRYKTRVLVNEINEDETPGGSWVHVLSLSCQMFKNPLPTPEQKAAFDRAMEAIRWQPEQRTAGLVKLPSGLVVNERNLRN